MKHRLRHVATINPQTPEFDALSDSDELPFLPLEAVWPGVRLDVERRRPKAAVSTGYTRFREGDILVPKITPTFEADRTVIVKGLEGGIGAGTTELHIVRVGPNADARYVSYLLSSKPFLSEGEASMIGVAGQKRVPDDCLRDLSVPVSNPRLQRAIAEYLDRETARIDALIAKRRGMVKLLEERFAVWSLNEALGANLGEHMVESSSGIYGTVPSRWTQTPLRHFRCDVQTGPFGSQLHADEYVEDGWPVVNPQNLIGGTITELPGMAISDEKRKELERHILRRGDIVFGRRGEMGRAGLVGPEHEGWVCGTGSLMLRVRDDRLDPPYLKLLLETSPARSYFRLASVGSTMDNLNSDIVLSFPVLAPPMVTQSNVVNAIVAERGRLEELKTQLTAQASLLLERRQALITAAVTGELDVPGVAA